VAGHTGGMKVRAGEIETLVAALETADHEEQRRTSRALLELGPKAAPALLAALGVGADDTRKAAAFLLGFRRETVAVPEALARALGDAVPKVRQNAAISLGRLAHPETAAALIEALRAETVGWVRPSLILALGAVGGPEARAALEAIEATDGREREALRKALDRTETGRAVARWRAEGARALPLLLEAPPGLEEIARQEAAEQGLPLVVAGPGVLRAPGRTLPAELIPALRCVHGLLIPAGEVAAPREDSPRALTDAVLALLAVEGPLAQWREWAESDDGTLHYRLALEGLDVRRDRLRILLGAARERLAPLGMVDSPSHYDIELLVRAERSRLRLDVRPSFTPDDRFAYRVKDVGAAISPVVAACLARLARTGPAATVFDPTCGSGTLLIERLMLDPEAKAIGGDVSRTAVMAARANVRTAGLESRLRISAGDAAAPESWPECDEVIANLPFGLRTRRGEMDLRSLYAAVLTHTATRLSPHGRAVLFTANGRAFDAALTPHRRTLRVEANLKVHSGGIWARAYVLRRVTRRHEEPELAEDAPADTAEGPE
jgi:predicted RNA methylase